MIFPSGNDALHQAARVANHLHIAIKIDNVGRLRVYNLS